ncbi:MAG: insulinase family protein [Pegethrix bostrychoides GSE-TBD4-15B]|jgi:zinc protease|uniref:Insulinase family protein n=1 Tax=Pegethrix bostrychoides GSE-TBD4-15B TaxID=2839662 RepID=A0A951U449_9CYAN|nr:insulinase family protein [Pegethrix bostrychoides GSE-TBD4-15B]
MWFNGYPQKWLRYGFLALMIALALGVGVGSWSPALAITPQHYSDLKFPPAPEIKLPPYSQFELSNGLKVYLAEDHELPLVSGVATLYTGDRLEPAEKTGLASIVGDTMRSGGTLNYPAEALNQFLEQRAASVESGIDTTAGSASFSSLSEDLEPVFSRFAEVLRQPAFPAERIEFAKSQWRGAIARRNDSPDAIAGREFQKLIYGASSPYARTIEYSTLEQISRADVLSFYQQYYHPNNMLLGIVGDFDSAQMRTLIEAKFGDWPAGSPPVGRSLLEELPEVSQVQQGGLFLVDQPQLSQSSIQMGHLGGKYSSPDYAPLSVVNGVLNGLGGRLVNEVRSRQGLAYSVYAYWSPQFDYPGLFVAAGQTRSEATVPFIKATLSELEKIRSAPITDAELALAKDSVLNAFIFNFATPAQTLSRVMRYDYYGYPQDFIFQYQKQLKATTAADVQRVAQAYLKPEQLVTLVVGNAAAIQPPLSGLGAVTPIDVSIPAPAGV